MPEEEIRFSLIVSGGVQGTISCPHCGEPIMVAGQVRVLGAKLPPGIERFTPPPGGISNGI